jgi:hypothetical protein
MQQSRSTNEGVFEVDAFGRLTFSPVKDFFGLANIEYTVASKGGEISNSATVRLNVTNVNDAPVIVGQKQNDVSTPAGEPISITLDFVEVADPDNTFPGDFSLEVLPGADYALSQNSVTPDANFSGALAIPIVVRDGASSSEQFNLNLLVTKKQATTPAITGQTPDPLVTDEDEGILISLSNLQVTDDDDTYPTGFTLAFPGGGSGNYSISGGYTRP